MSEYPHPSHYGSQYGHQGPNQPPYLQSAYPGQYIPSNEQPTPSNYPYTMGQNLHSSNTAYGYNQNLPNTGLAPGVSATQSAYPGWGQDQAQSLPFAHQSSAAPPQEYRGYFPQQAYAPPTTHTQASYNNYAPPAEEGELSDGDFEPRGAGSFVQGYDPTQPWAHDGTGYLDTAHRAVFANQGRNTPQSARTATGYGRGKNSPRRQTSASYSPYASPKESEYDPSKPDYQYGTSTAKKAVQHKGGNDDATTRKASSQKPQSFQSINSDKPSPSRKTFSNAGGTLEPVRATQSSSGSINKSSGNLHGFTSEEISHSSEPVSAQPLLTSIEHQSLRKDAKEAIQELFEKGPISYQTYIDEGIDQKVLAKYYEELGKTKEPEINSAPLESAVTITPASAPSVNGTTPKTLPSSSVTASPINTKVTAPTEKERLLQSKMEALRKSREERAQKAAAKSASTLSKPATMPEPAKMTPAISLLGSDSANHESTFTSTKVASPPSKERELSQQSQQAPDHPPQTQNITSALPSTVAGTGSVIPGLFLASTSTGLPSLPKTTNATASQTETSHPVSRKRPVAADFDGPSTLLPKRPFGQNRTDQPLVIDISEDDMDSDDGDVAMELDSQHDETSPAPQISNLVQRAVALHDLPPLTNFPPRKPYSTPPSGAGTPSAPQQQPKTNLSKPEDLQRKMREIEQMKKKIADAEARKMAKKQSSGSNTPKKPVAPVLPSKVETAEKLNNLVAAAENKVSIDQQKLAIAQAAEVEKANELERSELEQKRLRREKLMKELPLVDAEVQQKQNQLEQLQAQMLRIQAAIDQDLAEKERMLEERERLGQEAEIQLQAQKAKLQEIEQEDKESAQIILPQGPREIATEPELDGASHSLGTQLPASPLHSSHDEFAEEASKAISVPRETSAAPMDIDTTNDDNEQQIQQPEASNPSAETAEHVENIAASPDEILEAALQEAVRADVESIVSDEGQNSTGVMDETYAPDPSKLEPEFVGGDVEKQDHSPVISSLPGRDSPDPVGTEPDNYEPPEVIKATEILEYEPPEASPVDDLQSSPMEIASPPFSPLPAEDTSNLQTPADAGSPSSKLLIIDNDEQAQESEQDTRSEIIPLQNQSPQDQVLEEKIEKKDGDATAAFAPYESPLKVFRAYRFHPEFKKAISGGYRSMTYSHKFDPKQELCRYELAGGFCNDPGCDLQHFKNINLSDNDILASLASHTEFSGEQRSRFVSGLKEIFARLRERGEDKDFDSIASALVAHRAKFLGDDSKVLLLDGTTV